MPLKFRIQIKTSRKRKPPERLRRQYKRDFQNVLRKIGAKGVNNIKSEITKRKLIKSGDMFKSVNYKMTPQGVRYTVEKPAQYLEKGIRAHSMKYLLNSKKPIPITTQEGNLIFRWATNKSIGEGKWRSKGFKKGKGFMRTGVKRTRKELLTEIRKILRKVFAAD